MAIGNMASRQASAALHAILFTGLGWLVVCGVAPVGAATLVEAVSSPGAQTPTSTEWLTLLDGSDPKTMANWNRIGQDNWRFEDGAVVADSRFSRDSNFLTTKKSYEDFELKVEFWVDEEADSGVMLRGLDPYRVHARNSYEVNICDRRCEPGYGTAAITNFARVEPPQKAAGKWNTLDITAKGNHIVVIFNGVTTADMLDSTFPAGPITLQYGGGVVKWRKVQLKLL